NPLHGVGLDTFKIAFPYYSGIEFNQIDGMFMSSRAAHNEWLQIAATTGLGGLAAYLALLFFFFRTWWRGFHPAQGNAALLSAALFCCAAAYQIQNFFSFGVAGINFLWFFCLAAVQKLPSPPAPPKVPSGLWQKGVLVLLTALIGFYALGRLGADAAFARGFGVNEFLKQHDPNLDPDQLLYYSNYGIGEIGKAVRLCPLEVKYPLYLGLSYEERAKLDGAHEQE